MPVAITNQIKITVDTSYQGILTDGEPKQVFAYRIRIENNGEYTVKLLRRHWFITDAGNTPYEVEGEGVVGRQPVIEPGQAHTYVSGVHLHSDFGKMHGTYLMERQWDGKKFRVDIPLFELIVPFRLN